MIWVNRRRKRIRLEDSSKKARQETKTEPAGGDITGGWMGERTRSSDAVEGMKR